MSDSRPANSQVSVIGLGNMGAALARAFLDRGMHVVVWNRTAGKAQPLVDAGATLAPSAAAAVAASPLAVICATDMAASKKITRTPEFAAALRGRVLADVGTGTATDAREAAAFVHAAGGRYLDGGILCYPRDIGTADAGILYAGDGDAFRKHESTLAALAGAQQHVGDEPGAAATAYLALWAFYFGSLTAYFEAGALAATAGVGVERFQAMAATMMPKLSDGIGDATERMVKQNFAGDQAPIDIYVENLMLVRDAFAARRISHLTVDAFLNLLQAAKQAGCGDQDVAAVFDGVVGRRLAGSGS